jgi:hypothetical protein
MISGSIVCSMRQYIKLADRHAFTGRGALLLRKDVSDGESDRRQSHHWLGEGEKSGNFFRSAGGRSWPIADTEPPRFRVRYREESGHRELEPSRQLLTQSGHCRFPGWSFQSGSWISYDAAFLGIRANNETARHRVVHGRFSGFLRVDPHRAVPLTLRPW